MSFGGGANQPGSENILGQIVRDKLQNQYGASLAQQRIRGKDPSTYDPDSVPPSRLGASEIGSRYSNAPATEQEESPKKRKKRRRKKRADDNPIKEEGSQDSDGYGYGEASRQY